MRRKKLLRFAFLTSLIFLGISFFAPILFAQSKQPRWIVVEGVILKVHHNKLYILNSQTKVKESYILTDKTLIKPKRTSICSVSERSKEVNVHRVSNLRRLRKDYVVVLKINPKDQTIIEVFIKEMPQ